MTDYRRGMVMWLELRSLLGGRRWRDLSPLCRGWMLRWQLHALRAMRGVEAVSATREERPT